MTCPICDKKPMNCDCTLQARENYAYVEELQSELTDLRTRIRSLADGWIKACRIPEGKTRTGGPHAAEKCAWRVLELLDGKKALQENTDDPTT